MRKRSQQAKNEPDVLRDPPDRTVALLVETRDRKKHVVACCERAEAVGVVSGMSLAHASSLLIGLRTLVLPFTPDEDALGLERLAVWATRFTPVVAVDRPDGLLLDIAGCDHLFGGIEQLTQHIDQEIKRMGLLCRLCVAPNFACAQAVARYATEPISLVDRHSLRDVLAPLPIEALRIDTIACDALNEVGVALIGQLLRLPRKELASRFGVELLHRLDQALGGEPEYIEPITIRQPLVVTRYFNGPVLSIEIVVSAARELLESLVERLERKGCGLSELVIECHRINLEPVHFTFSLTYPTRDPKHLWSLIQPKVQRIHLGYGVEEVHLQATYTARLAHEQRTLLSNLGTKYAKADDAHVGKLLDQLTDRLGRRAVSRVRPVDSYLPERSFQRQFVDMLHSKQTGDLCHAPRPSRLFPTPDPVKVVTLVPDGPPAWIQWRGQAHTIRSSLGPERIGMPWWDSDEPTAARDYYEVQDELGQWLWVFREHRNHCHTVTCQWFVHGAWA